MRDSWCQTNMEEQNFYYYLILKDINFRVDQFINLFILFMSRNNMENS